MVDRLSGISVFVQVADSGSFARASEQLGLTRSAVGKTIARLEERLGVRLFNRTTRAQSLTDEGQSFYERCQRILADIQAAEAALGGSDRSPTGVLRVSAPVLLGRLCVAPILVGLTRRHPSMELDLRFADHLVDLVEERIDLAVRIGPLPDRAGLIARSLDAFDMVVCAAPTYLAMRGCPSDLSELPSHDCLPYARRGGRAEPWRFATKDGAVIEFAVGGRIRLDDLEAVAEAAVDGAGIACLPTWLVDSRLQSGQLVRVLNDHRALGNSVYAVWSQAAHAPSRVRVAVNELRQCMPARLARPDAAH
ncbi:DNA-binding transcriptional LysR family regulator [Bradyrhizobium sp. USDA 372]